MAAPKRMTVRFNRELRKAVHSGNGYDDYMTIYQFLQGKIALLNQRIVRMKRSLEAFYDNGGTIDTEDGTYIVSIEDVSLTVIYDEDGDVTDYSVVGLKGKREMVMHMLGLFFSVHLIPVYEDIIRQTEEQIANLENDNVLRGMSEIRDLLRNDKYLTVAAVSDLDVSSESVDPFGIFGDES